MEKVLEAILEGFMDLLLIAVNLTLVAVILGAIALIAWKVGFFIPSIILLIWVILSVRAYNKQ